MLDFCFIITISGSIILLVQIFATLFRPFGLHSLIDLMLILSVLCQDYSRIVSCTRYQKSTFLLILLVQYFCCWTIGIRGYHNLCSQYVGTSSHDYDTDMFFYLIYFCLQFLNNVRVIIKTKVNITHVYVTVADFSFCIQTLWFIRS